MKTLVFGGSSDDTFGEITPRGDDYDNCASGKPIEWALVSESEGCGLLVVGQYAPGRADGWLVGVAPMGDDECLPPWPMRLRAANPAAHNEAPYSPVLEIDVPDDTTIQCLQASGGGQHE